MEFMTAAEVRKTFVDFFVDRGHVPAASSSLIPNDPSLLFTVAGMVPFKSYFVGEEAPPFKRAVSIQKCVRAGGKHNDLEEVGRTSRHLTFFEMLGNFSFGDYFKTDAILWAWQLVTEKFGLDPNRLWVTVHHSDDEAADIWHRQVGVPEERIQRLDEDNFWRMADVGPCGPCSEIFWDKGPDYGASGGPAHGDEDRYVEIWNLVFMQFETTSDGSEIPLPKPSIDTGMGLERTVSVLQGVDSVWETDEFVTLLEAIQRITGVKLGVEENSDTSLRILADHARSTSMLISDGVFPSNENRGYVLRRIIRRAARHAWMLGVERPVMAEIVDRTVEVMGLAWSDLKANHQYVRDVIDREEKRFLETLRVGQSILDERLSLLNSGDQLSGDTAFLLHDTYGLPLEVTVEIASGKGVSVDLEGFRTEMKQQQRRAKSARKTVDAGDASLLVSLVSEFGTTEFTGRAELTSQARVLYVSEDRVVLDRTPFYAESGGQIGDTGEIHCEATGARVRVVDTFYGLPGLYVHRIEPVKTDSTDSSSKQNQDAPHDSLKVGGVLNVGDVVTASVDAERRAAIRRSHTGTHILHWALRDVLGTHAKQQGSWVGPDRLRFDFSHYESLTEVQIKEVEDLVNNQVLLNDSCRHFETTMGHAQQLGAIAFFGDKYGDTVRVLEAGRHSVELCGGTHVKALGDIGAVRIVAESSIGANIRRVEAITGLATVELLRDQHALLNDAARALSVPPADLVTGIASRKAELKQLRKETSELRRKLALSRTEELVAAACDGVVVARIDNIDRVTLRDLALAVRDHENVKAAVLGCALPTGGAALVAAVTADSVFNAGVLISEAKKTIGGGGKPSPDLATAGGRNAERLDEALDQVRSTAAIN
ncbi:MAG: alanine--tRNA ligase [Acidimicrobiaceae bacterium]|nr:alanine--tRNA ligase [Acidimicrobiaceae bacterium]